MPKKLLLIIALFASIASAQDSVKYTNAIRKSFDSEKITVAAVAIGFTSSKINPTVSSGNPDNTRASAASCTLETADVRILTSGTPTSSTGMYVTAGQSFTIFGYTDIAAFLAIRISGTSGVLNCVYYR